MWYQIKENKIIVDKKLNESDGDQWLDSSWVKFELSNFYLCLVYGLKLCVIWKSNVFAFTYQDINMNLMMLAFLLNNLLQFSWNLTDI